VTPKQRNLLVFIIRYMADRGHAPSFAEMVKAMGLHSKAGIHRMLGALEERGYIARRANRARAIEILRRPDGSPGALSMCREAQQDVVAALDGRVLSTAAVAALAKARNALALAGAAA